MPLRFGLAAGATDSCRLREQAQGVNLNAAVGASAIASVGDPFAGQRDCTQLYEIPFNLGVADLRQQAIIRLVLAIGHVVQVVIATGLRGGDFL